MKNTSGILPTEFKVVVLPDAVEEKSKGGIIIPDQKKDQDQFAQQDGVLVAVSPLAFSYASESEWGGHKPKPGDRVSFARYAGALKKGKDGKDYRIVNDKDLYAVLEG